MLKQNKTIPSLGQFKNISFNIRTTLLEPNTMNHSHKNAVAVDYFIYNKNSGCIAISTNTKKFLGIPEDTNCNIDIVKSHILGIDIPNFVKQFNRWLSGDTSEVIRVTMVNKCNRIKSIQIKGHIKYNEEGDTKTIYGAFIDTNLLIN